MEQQGSVQSLERAFGLLELLAARPEGMQLAELAIAAGLHKSTVHRLLKSLAALGYVRQGEPAGRYRLTLKLLELSGQLTDEIDVLATARLHLEQLRDRTGETVHLVVRDGSSIVYIFKAESRESPFRMFSRIGMRREMYCTAAGKSMLAVMDHDRVGQIWQQSDIRPYTPHTILTVEQLMEELAGIRRRGYALDNEENELGVRCIAAAIRDMTGEASAAFSISAPTSRMTDERIAVLAKDVVETQARICAELGYRGTNYAG